MNPTILTKIEQELFDKYKPLFAAQHFELSASETSTSQSKKEKT